MKPRLCTASLVAFALLVCIARAEDVRGRMNDLVDSVKDAVKEAEAAGKKREVVDLGQSLHLLESKFSDLRAALSHELGAKSKKLSEHTGSVDDLMKRSNDLIAEVVTQREELRLLSGDVKEVDSAIRALREGLNSFEKDVTDLSKVMSDLHLAHNELSASHDETKERMRQVIADNNDRHLHGGGGHALFVLALLIELGCFVGYLYFKRPGGMFAHKAYGKFG